MIDFVNETGLGSIGTVDDAVAQIERLMKQSNGGFGCYLLLAHEWANPVATHRSFELITQHVFPQFQGQAYSTLEAKSSGNGLEARDGGRPLGSGGTGHRQVSGRHRVAKLTRLRAAGGRSPAARRRDLGPWSSRLESVSLGVCD